MNRDELAGAIIKGSEATVIHFKTFLNFKEWVNRNTLANASNQFNGYRYDTPYLVFVIEKDAQGSYGTEL